MLQKILALMAAFMLLIVGAYIIAIGTEGFEVEVDDVVPGQATTVTIKDAIFTQEKLDGDHEVIIEVGGHSYKETLTFDAGEASFTLPDTINEIGEHRVSVTVNDRVKVSTLNVFMYMVTDDRGKDVGFFDHPQKIVSLGKAFSEILCELDRGDTLAATDSYSKELADKYPALAEADDLGALSSSWDSETIAGMEPDLVIMHDYRWGAYPELMEHLEGLGVKVVAYYPANYDEVMDLVERFGVLVDNPSAASDLKGFMDDVREEVVNKVAAVDEQEKPKTYGELRNGLTVNNGSLLHELIVTAGGINVAQNDSAISTYKIEPENVVVLGPEIILLEDSHPKSSEKFRSDYELSGSVEIKRVTDDYINYSPSLAYGLMEIAGYLHPGIDFDFSQTP